MQTLPYTLSYGNEKLANEITNIILPLNLHISMSAVIMKPGWKKIDPFLLLNQQTY